MRTGKIKKMAPEEREALRQQKLEERFKFEAENMGGYELLYPCSNPTR